MVTYNLSTQDFFNFFFWVLFIVGLLGFLEFDCAHLVFLCCSDMSWLKSSE